MATYLIPRGTRSIDIPVVPGTYNVQVTAEGYTQQIEGGVDVTVGRGETVEVNLGTMSVIDPSEEDGEAASPEGDGGAIDTVGKDEEKNTSVILLVVVALVALILFGR